MTSNLKVLGACSKHHYQGSCYIVSAPLQLAQLLINKNNYILHCVKFQLLYLDIHERVLLRYVIFGSSTLLTYRSVENSDVIDDTELWIILDSFFE